MNLIEKEIQGVAVYLEFRKPGATVQVIVTPDGYTKTDTQTRSTFYRRQLSEYQMKKRWRQHLLPASGLLLDRLAGADSVSADEQDNLTSLTLTNRTATIQHYLEGLIRGNYKLVKNPIYIEVTKEDLTLVNAGETPTKIINRIKAARIAAEFPEEIISN